MTGAMKALVVLDHRVDRGLVESLMTSSRELDVAEFVDLTAHQSPNGTATDALIVACGEFSPAVIEYIGDASRTNPGRPILLICPAAGNGHVAEAMGAGADDILTLPAYGDVETAHAMSREVIFS